MGSLKEKYLQKCGDFACDPISSILKALDAGRPLNALALNGKDKDLFHKRVKPMQVFALCETLYEYDELSVVQLPYNFLNDMAVQAISRLIQMNSRLHMLDLTGNEVTGKGAAGLAGVLSRPDAGLQALVLRNNPLGDEGVLEIAQMLRSNTSLTLLDLADTHCGIKGFIGIANALTDGNNTLKILDLEDVQVQVKGPQDSTTQQLIRMLAANSSLSDLSLAKQRLTDHQLEQLVTFGFARSQSTWLALSLRGNHLSPFAGPHLERLLQLCPRLQRLNLASNALGNDGAISLSRCLSYCPDLRDLDVRSNSIGDVGLQALAGTLHMVHSLQVFMVWGNNFGPGACRALADTLSHPAVRRVRTDVRPYTVDGEVMLAHQELS